MIFEQSILSCGDGLERNLGSKVLVIIRTISTYTSVRLVFIDFQSLENASQSCRIVVFVLRTMDRCGEGGS